MGWMLSVVAPKPEKLAAGESINVLAACFESNRQEAFYDVRLKTVAYYIHALPLSAA